jgi:hypothetical protein
VTYRGCAAARLQGWLNAQLSAWALEKKPTVARFNYWFTVQRSINLTDSSNKADIGFGKHEFYHIIG